MEENLKNRNSGIPWRRMKIEPVMIGRSNASTTYIFKIVPCTSAYLSEDTIRIVGLLRSLSRINQFSVQQILLISILCFLYVTMKPIVLFWIFGAAFFVSVSLVESKKLLKKKQLMNTESTVQSDSTNTVKIVDATEQANGTLSITPSDASRENVTAVAEKSSEKKSKNIAKPKPGFKFFDQITSLIQQLMSFMGISASFQSSVTSGQRRQKGIDTSMDQNLTEPDPISYRDDLRTTVGAALGRAECWNKAACRAGKYLRSVRGKEIILVLLEKFAPEKWLETVGMVKDSAIHSDDCHYECFERA